MDLWKGSKRAGQQTEWEPHDRVLCAYRLSQGSGRPGVVRGMVEAPNLQTAILQAEERAIGKSSIAFPAVGARTDSEDARTEG
jgi:hypothetical protein